MTTTERIVQKRDHHQLAQCVLGVLWLVLMIVALAGAAVLAYGTHYANCIYEGITIQGVPVGGLTPEQAREALRQRMAQEGAIYVSLYTSERTWVVSANELGGSFDLDDAVRQAWRMGRGGNFVADWIDRCRLLWQGYQIVPAFRIEPGPALIYLRRVAKQVGNPARRAQLWVAGLQARTGESQVGREMDIVATREAIERQVRDALGASSWGNGIRWPTSSGPAPTMRIEPISVALVFREIAPPITEVAGARERASVILSSPVTLLFSAEEPGADGVLRPLTRRWSVDQAVLASWLTLQRIQTTSGAVMQVTVDEDEIAEYLQALADQIARPPREARFDYDSSANTLTTLSPGQNGYALDVQTATRLVANACLSSERQVELPVAVIPPRVTRADLEKLLPLALISEGESSFQGSTAGRLQNIRVASARFHGLVVPPGATFSFLEHLGLVTVANGYSEAWIIYGDRTVLGPGGGVCQVSTTCFRAAFWGGYPIVERSPHSYRVSWYEPPVGLDAAVFSPVVDMKFRNDTTTPILILTYMDEVNAKLYFRFYGQPVGRKVTLDGPVTDNPVKAGDPVYDEDPALAPGERVQVENAHDGLDVTLYRVIEQSGQETIREKIFSRYEPWPARYRVGPAKTANNAQP